MAGLSEASRKARIESWFQPYHDAIEAVLLERMAHGAKPIVIAVHLMASSLDGRSRPWQISASSHGDRHIGDPLLGALRAGGDLCEGDNEPFSRKGGDEFVILLSELEHPGDANGVAEKVHAAFEIPLLVDGREFRITASIGISLFPSDGDNADAMLRQADAAMYQAKADGPGKSRFSSADVNLDVLHGQPVCGGDQRTQGAGIKRYHGVARARHAKRAFAAFAEAARQPSLRHGSLVRPADLVAGPNTQVRRDHTFLERYVTDRTCPRSARNTRAGGRAEQRPELLSYRQT